MHPVLKDSGVVHIWYYIPLCTIFAKKSNGDVFRTQFHDYKIKVLKFITNFEGGLFSSSVWQSMVAIRRPFQDPNHLALQELGWQFFQDYSKGNSQRLFIIQSVVKAASTSILLGQPNWSIEVVIKNPVWPWINWANSYSTVGIQSHSFNSQDG
ncbi:hypothetical protein O181_093374 [Austropuccinia psidii MF-1]|uniref:Uncharacterized protein n=1 Tax=Austropuccinia psidii MF-1 TaxID=1389203 RepID=A0A9Q3J1B8_9BASI|nr:hypothetical protein [Austropuccinia psidii MF-1]